MSRNSRLALIGAALVVLVVALVVLQPGSDTTKTSTSVFVVTVKGLKPVGGVQKLTVKKGQRARYTVTSDRPEEVHTHGYNIAKNVGPNMPARFDFPATIDGIFDVELEHHSVPILKLTVNP